MHFLHSGQQAEIANRPEALFCTQARQQANFAPQVNAFFASLMSAGFARDSINYYIDYELIPKWFSRIEKDL